MPLESERGARSASAPQEPNEFARHPRYPPYWRK
jgi:hypothetical protein